MPLPKARGTGTPCAFRALGMGQVPDMWLAFSEGLVVTQPNHRWA
jgi:hypothetical protein